jgi:PAS domain S-box-containing protein
MNLREKSPENKITEIKKDILKLQKELDELYSEHNRLSDLAYLSPSQNISEKLRDNSIEELKRSEKLYRTLVESANSIIIRWDMNATLLYANEYALRFFGYSYSEMIGMDVRRLVPTTENSGRDLSTLIEEIISSPEKYLQFENENIRKNGEHVWVNWANRIITDDEGNFAEIMAIGNDITGIKRTEEKLARERELFEGIFNNIPVMITIYDPEIQNFRFNKEFKKLTGWTEEDAADRKFIEKVYPDAGYRQEVIEFMLSLTPGWKECNMTTKNGSQLISSWANILLTNGVQIGIGIDVRERKQTESTLKENEQRLRASFNNAAIGIVEVDPNDRFINANRRICEMLGYEESEFLGKNVREITAPEDRDMSDSVNEKIHSGEVKVQQYEKRYLRRDGSIIWVNVIVSGVYDSDGKHINSIGTVEDITERKKTEKALRDSEERLRLLADNISQMVWTSDPTGKPFWFNKRWYDYTGTTLDELQQSGYLLVNHPEQSKKIYQNYLKSIESGQIWEETYQMRNKNGEYRWFLTRMVPVSDNQGKISVWFGTSTDIHEKIQSEESLRKNEQRLSAIFNNAAIGIVELDNQTKFIMVNDRVCEILGYSKEELLNKTVLDVTAPEDKEHSRSMYEAIAMGETNMLNYEKRYIKKDGNQIWVHISISAIRNEFGEYIRSIGTVKDITNRKATEGKLKESEEKFRSLFENITEGVALYEVVKGPESRPAFKLIDVNPAFKEYTQYNSEKDITKLFQDCKNSYPYDFAHVAETREPFKFEGHLAPLNKDFVINVISPKHGQFATVLEDITEQKRIELELKQKNDELTRFIYTVSHDLKSPLVTIKSFTTYLKEDIVENDIEAQSKDINFIQGAVDRMGRLLDELLELSRIGRKEITKTYVSLQEILKNATEMVAGRLAQKHVQVTFTGPEVMLYGHSERLVQLYQNLLDNAAKFTGDQKQPLVEIGSFVDADNQIVLYVKDNGLGIDPKYHHKIFGLFEKLDVSTEGTGIGLALIKRIVEVHGGDIWFHSDGVGKGTIFYFTLEKTYVAEE